MDIVECLRATTESSALKNEAVAEIERLRAENEIFRTHCSVLMSPWPARRSGMPSTASSAK